MYGQAYQALGYLRRQYRIILQRCSLLNSIPYWLSFGAYCALIAAPSSAEVVIDGRTATQVTSSGVVTDVRTSTLQSGVGLNSFSKFNVYSGETVNLHVPGSASALLNIVRDQSTTINGLLNSYQDGVLGGNVFFANPHGFVVGKTGVLNVGSLTVTTPTIEFLDRVVGAGGATNASAINQLISGNGVPLSTAGVINIQGRINALNALTLDSSAVTVEAGAQLNAGYRGRAEIQSLVNTAGLVPGGALVVEDGKVSIIASQKATIGGKIQTDGAGVAQGGNISITAPHISLSDGAELNAAGSGDARSGDISLIANNVAGFEEEAVAKAQSDVSIAIGNNVKITGGKIAIVAQSSLGSTLEAAQDAVAADAEADAEADTPGAVAEALGTAELRDAGLTPNQYGSSLADEVLAQLAKAEVALGVQVLSSKATVTVGDGAVISGTDAVGLSAKSFVTAAAEHEAKGLGVLVIKTQSDAQVSIGASRISSSGGNVDIQARNTNVVEGSLAVEVASEKVPVGISALVNISNGSASTKVAAGARIESAKSVNIGAEQIKSFELSNEGASGEGSVIVGVLVDVSSMKASTEVAGTVIGGEDVTIYAKMETQSNAIANTVLLGEVPKNALEKKIEELEEKKEKIEAASKNVSESLTQTISEHLEGQESEEQEQPAEEPPAEEQPPAEDKTPGKLRQFLDNFGVVGSVAVTNQDNAAQLTVKGTARIKAGGNLDVASEVTDILNSTVTAKITPLSEKQDPNDPSKSSLASNGKKNGLGVSVLVADQSSIATTKVESGAQLDATGELHIGSKAEQPLSLVRMVKGIKNLWEDTNSPFQNDQLTNKDSWDWLSTQFEEVQMTSTRAQTSVAVGTNAEPQVDSGANISGSVTVSNVGLKAQTVVADNVKINQDPAYQDAAQSVKIDSHVAAEMINVVGDPQTLLAKNGNDFKPPAKPLPPNSNEQGASAGGGAKRGLGASVGYNAYAVDSQVTVGNVEITAKDVTIESHNQVFDISGAVTGASSGNDALGGSVILNYFDNTSQATLGAGSTVHVANDLTVKATDDLFHVGLAGAVMKSSVNSFGFGVAYTNVQRDTQAAIVETGAGDIQAGNAIEVVAQNDGWVGGVAVAAAMAKKSTPQPGTGSATAGAEAPTEVGSATKDPSGNQSAKSGVTVSGAAVVNDISDKVVAQVRGTANVAVTDNAAKGLVVNAKNDTDMVALAPSMAVSMGAQQPSNSKNMAGSYAQNSVANQVKAGVSASEVRVKGGGVNIQADNAVDIVSVAAGAAGSSGQSGMNLAGSVTYNKINNTVESQLSNASVVHVEQGGLTVRTVDEGDITSIAGAAGVSGKGAAGMGFGVSVNRIASTTSAQVNGVKSIDVGSSDDVVVDSENHGDITSVAASLGFSRDGYAVTGAAAYNAVTATNKAEMVGSEVEQARNVSVTALSDPKIFTVAGQAGISLNDKAVGASAAYNTITTSTTAQMSDSVANAQQRVVVQGKQESSIKALAVGAQVAGGSLALQGSLAINTIDNDAAAKVIRSDVDAKGSVDVVASDTSGIQVLTGSAAIGFKGGTAVGIAGSYNEINGDVVASVEGGTVDSSNDSVRVDAVRTQSVESLAAGVAASGPGGKAALAGSVAVNRLLGSTRTEVKASAEGGAVIHAKNNALVRANTTNTVKTLAGGMGVGFSAVGAGLAVEINQLKGETSAIVSGAGTQVNAHGYGAKDGDVAGVGVTAESKDTLTSVAMGIGVAKSVGVGGAVAVNMLGGKTTAQVNQASLNQGTEGADADQSARVTARHASTADNYVLVVGASGTAGVGVGIAVTFQEHETVASTDAAALAAKDVVEVNAHGTGSVKGKVAGLGGGGTAGINGSVNVIKVADETRSTVKDSTLSGQGATRVVADADHQADAMVGSVAAGGGAGVGVSLAVTLANATTVAETAGSSQLNSTGKTEVKANARDNYDHTVATAGLGGSAGVAASVSVLVSEASTRATLGGTTQVNQNAQLAGEAQSVAVEAAQWFNTDVDTGSGAIGGGAGVGAALDVQVLRSGAVAQVGAGTNVKAAGDVSVDAKNERYVDSLAAALGGGGAVGIGAGISVINVSSVAEKKATEALENKLNDATSSARDNNGIGSQMGSGYAGSADLVNTASSKQQTIAPNATYASDIDPEKYSAGAHAMGTVQARNLQVRADNRSEVTSNAWGVAAGGTAAGGAGVSVVSVGDNSAAVLGGKATVSKDVLVRSNDYQDKAVKTLARAGAASFTGSLGAALSISSKSSTSKAAVADGASIVSQGRLTVRSQLDQKLEAETANLSLSLGAGVGISMGTTSTKGSAQALVGRAVNLKASHVNVSAEATSGTGVTALGASGGALLAANGAVAIASDATSARTFVDDGSTLEATGDTPQDAGGDINLTAVATPQVNTDAMGAALAGGLAVAASVSQATADVSAQATTGRANLKGKNLNVSAWANGSDKPNAKASSFAGSGAGLVGANATVANATTTTSVSAGVGDGAVVALTGDATVLARDTGSARVDASGVSVGGLAGIGVTSSDVVVRANTNASFGASGVVGKTLSVKTNGDNTVTGKLIAGSGGVLAGAATLLEGENHGSSKVRMGSSTNVTAGNIDVAAFRRANYKLEAESMQASVVGASGTTVDYDQNSTTEVNIGKGAKLTSMGSMQVQALTTVNGSATGQGGSGGVAAGGAVMVDTASTANTAVNIGDNAELTLVGNRLGRSLPMTIEARNDHSTADTAELWMAAAAGGPYAEANGDVTQNADVRIGDGAKIISNGRLGIGTLSKANSTSNANVTVYGLAAIGGGNTRNHVDSNEKVTVGTKARIHADDNLQLAAGRNASGTETGAVVSNAHTTVVNNTLIPITATMEGEARTNTRSILTLGKDSTVTSVLGVKLESIAAEATADGSSTGTNPFLSAFSAEDSRRDQKSTSMGTVSLDNATVVAGVSHTQELIFDEDGKATVRSALGDLSFQYTSGYKPLDELAAQIQKVSDQLAMAADPADRQLLQSQLDALNQARNDMATNLGSQTTVGQIEVGPIYAGGGDVEIKADLVFGAGAKVDAYGVPVVVVRNNTKNFLVMGDAKLVSTGAGEVRYTGKANQVLGAASLTNHTKGIASVYNADSAPSVPTLLIENTYDVKAPGHSGPAPAIHLKGNIENLQGSTVVTNMSGDMFQSGRVETLALDMKAPNGSVYINGGNDVYSVLDPSAEWYELVKQWLPQETFGSGNSARTLEESVAEFAANARFNPDGSKSKEELFQETVRGSDGNKLQHLYIGDSTYGWSRIDIGIENVVFIERQGDNLKDAIGTAGDAFYWSGWRIQDEGASDNLDFTLMYYAMINGRQTKHQAGYSSKPVQSPAPGIYAGKSVNIQSQFININAPVEAGRRTDVALKLDSNTAAEIAEHKNGTELYRLQSVAAKVNGEAATATAGSPSESPKVYWNQADQRIEVAGIDASGGGSITLTGGIINTGNALGKLTVNSGYGKIDIDNSTGEALLVKNLDAGNGGRGFVKVTDTLQAKTDKGEYKTTWFVREADSTDIKVYDNRNGGNSIDTAQLADTVQTASYNPLQGTRYNWSYTYSVQRNLKKDGVTVLGDVPWFGELHPDGEGVFKNASNDGWHVADGFATEKGQKYQRNAATVTTGHDNSDAGGVLTQSVNVTKALYNTLTVGDSSDGIGDNPSGSGEWGNLQGTQIRFYNHIDLDVNLSLKADNPIPVVFKGADKAQITVKSNAAVTVGGNLRNTKGLTQVVATKGDIVTDGTAMVRTQVVDLQADAGRVGGEKAQDTFNLMADSGAPVTIKARSGQGGVHMAVRGDAAIDTIAAAGQAVNVRSTESLRQAEGQTGVAITADVLHIEAASGKGIGEVDKPIVAQVKELNASSHGSIAIKQNQGNLSVGLVQSAFGDVALSAPDGHIVGAAPRADTFEADMQERIKLWESMKIVGDKDNTLARQAVTGYENKVKRLYNDYWFMRKLASDSSVSGFTLNDDGVNLFRLQVNVALGREATRDEVNTAIRERYQSAYGFLTTVQGISASQLATEDTTLATTYQLQAASAPAKRAGPDVATGAPAPDNGMVRATASAQSGSGAEVVTYESLTRGAQWSKEQLGAIINAGAEGGRPSTGAQPNVVASNGKVLLNNDVTKSVAPSVPVEFTLTRTPGSYTPTVKQTSAGEQYSAAQLRAFLANAKPGSAKLTVDPQDPNTIHVSLLQRNDLVVEAKDPVAVKSLADYHLGASQDVVLKDLDVQKTLYVYAGRDVVNGTEKGVASSKVGGLYIDAGRNIGTAAAPIQVAGHNGAAVQLEYVRAPGSMHADFVNTDVVVHDVQIGKGATLTAHQGSFQSAPDTQLDGKFWFEAQAMGSADQAFASVMKPQTEVRVLVDNAAYVTATQGDLRVGDSHASGNLALTSQEGSVLMAGTNEVLSSRKGSIDLFAMNDVGSTSAAMDLDTPKFNAVALSGDVTIKNQQKATADRVYASDGSVHLTVGGDLRPATTDLVIGDVRVAKNLTVKANSVEAKVQQTDNTTPLNVVVTDQQGKQADHVVLAVRDAATVNVEQLNTRTASVQTDADRLRFVQGTVGETMRFSTAHISGYMNNVSPTLEFSQPVQYFIPGKSFSIDVNGKVLANSQAPTYFRPALGVRTTTDVTSGFGVFDINRPTEHRDQRLTRDLTLPMATVAWMGAATPVASLVSAPSRAVNLADDENE